MVKRIGANSKNVRNISIIRTNFIAEDNMNVQLHDVTVTAREGSVTYMNQVFIRGSHIRFFSVPEILKNAPIFNPTHEKPPAPIRGPKRR